MMLHEKLAQMKQLMAIVYEYSTTLLDLDISEILQNETLSTKGSKRVYSRNEVSKCQVSDDRVEQ